MASEEVIMLSDEECIVIEETTIVERNTENECSTSFSLMSELDKLMEMKKRESSSKSTYQMDSDSDLEITPGPSEKKKSSTKTDEARIRKIEKDKEKTQKQEEKDKKREELKKKKAEKENEKATRKIEREMSSSINSKCEQYTFCHIGTAILEIIPDLKIELTKLYTERKLENQFIFENNLGTKIEWRRKCIEMRENDNNQPEKFEYISVQDVYAIIIPSQTLTDVINSNTLEDFIVQQKSSGRSLMLIVSYGKLSIQKKKIYRISLDIFEKHRAQIIQLETSDQVALFTAQFLRSIARREKKRVEHGEGEKKVSYDGEKGIVIGNRDEIVCDWWNKMLATIERISDAQRRAIIKHIPDPIQAIERFLKMDYSSAVSELANLVAENNRRVGEVMAHRIYTMLTDETGCAIVE
ncbi:unnamed protein product [Caenorhabditis angaria]|uniref:ERCC4 domain-containing protein n=1 Tax=Caenorhabditis angaria TaxID=860376 RepID=A0A9P1MWZ5_9PELO|nr:unnamed protein product [Caenorhabditis angaria]